MTTVLSERRPLGAWHQCTTCALMMGLDFAGFDAWPLGYTTAERDALNPANVGSTDEFVTPSAAVKARYGIALGDPTVSLSAALQTPGLAVAVCGVNARLPLRLRHWDPSFAGGHAMTFVSGRSIIELDPEATPGWPGDKMTLAEVLHWANNDGPHSYRVFVQGSYAAKGNQMPAVTDLPLLVVTLKPGGTIYALDGTTVVATGYGGAAHVHSWGYQIPRAKGAPLQPILISGAGGVNPRVALYGADLVVIESVVGFAPPPVVDQAAIAAATAQGRKAGAALVKDAADAAAAEA